MDFIHFFCFSIAAEVVLNAIKSNVGSIWPRGVDTHTDTHTHTLMVDRHGGEMDDDVFLLLKQTWPLFLVTVHYAKYNYQPALWPNG